MPARQTWSTVVAIARDELSSSAAGSAASLLVCRWAAWAWGAKITAEAPALPGAFRKGRGRGRHADSLPLESNAGRQRRVPGAKGRCQAPYYEGPLPPGSHLAWRYLSLGLMAVACPRGPPGGPHTCTVCCPQF